MVWGLDAEKGGKCDGLSFGREVVDEDSWRCFISSRSRASVEISVDPLNGLAGQPISETISGEMIVVLCRLAYLL